MKLITLAVLFVGACGLTLKSEAQTWIQTTAPNLHWQSIASSADGRKLVAVADNNAGNTGAIYTSTNSGITWMNNAPNTTWNSVASSADGNYLAATVWLGGIYTSTNAGSSWTKTSAPNAGNTSDAGWWSIASSADGTKLVATMGSGSGGSLPIYASTNSGATWTQTTAPLLDWTSVACSSDGTKLVAGAGYGSNGIYLSTNSASTWTSATNLPTGQGWTYVASSTDGIELVAATQNAGIYISTNSGFAWTVTTAPNVIYTSIASSANGTHLAAAASDLANSVYISVDSGATWTANGSPAASPAGGRVASSADGHLLAAALYYGGIYISSTPCIGLMKAVKPTFSDLWMGTNYQLQVSGDLISWTNQGSAFTPTNTTMNYPQYFDVSDWNQLFFRLQVAP